MEKKYSVMWIVFLIILPVMAGCAGQQAVGGGGDFRSPLVSLHSVNVPYYTGYWYFGNNVKPTRGESGNYGAPIGFSIAFEIENLNEFPVLLEGFSFELLFEGFDVATIVSEEHMWIPAGKINRLNTYTTLDVRRMLTTLVMSNTSKLKKKEVTAWGIMEKWWTQGRDLAYQIELKKGAAVFRAGDLTKVIGFHAVAPGGGE